MDNKLINDLLAYLNVRIRDHDDDEAAGLYDRLAKAAEPTPGRPMTDQELRERMLKGYKGDKDG